MSSRFDLYFSFALYGRLEAGIAGLMVDTSVSAWGAS